VVEAFKMIGNENNRILNVLDFGGSLGSSYFQNRNFLSGLKELKWNIVEQKHFVDCGKEFIEDGQLKFYYSIEEAMKSSVPNVLFASSVIQYVEKPYELIKQFLQYNFRYILIDRTAFIESKKERITIQVVPEFIYKASYPSWFLNKQKFVDAFLKRYELVREFESYTDPKEKLDGTWTYRKGFLFKLRNT
jgi:putative methyltransferase (TIGR04325 family)